MRIIATADLHYDIARSRGPTLRLAEEVCELDADVLLLLGDVAGRDPELTLECLHLFDRFRGRKFFVAGNHDIWTNPGGDSLRRLEEELPAVCRAADFQALDAEPAVLGSVGIVGSIGWYDYSFRPARLGIPLRFYREKIAPGAAARLPAYQYLVEDRSDIPEHAFQIGTRWMDGEHARLFMSDFDFCHRLLARLEDHLARVERTAERVFVGLHHLPLWRMVPYTERPSWAFASAFLGSELFGEILLDHPQVRYVVCGHSHKPDRLQYAHVECINVGSTYMAKHYEIIEL